MERTFTVYRESNLTGMDSSKQEDILLFVCYKVIEYKSVKLRPAIQ